MTPWDNPGRPSAPTLSCIPNGLPMEQVMVLNGGTIDWSAMEELSQEPVEPRPGGVTLKEANPDLFVEWTAIYDAVISRPNVVLLDARPTDMCTGEVIRHSIQTAHPGGQQRGEPRWNGRPDPALARR